MKATQSLTAFFDGSIKPARTGVYQRRYIGRIILYARWTGRRWRCACNSPDSAAWEKEDSIEQSLPWRGLAADPKGPQP